MKPKFCVECKKPTYSPRSYFCEDCFRKMLREKVENDENSSRDSNRGNTEA